MASSEKNITSFSILGNAGVIVANAIAVELPFGTDVTTLVATFVISNLASALIGVTPQVSGTTANDFTSPVEYIITAEDLTTQVYTVTVSITAASTSKRILGYKVDDFASIVNEATKSVLLPVTEGYDVSSITPEITISEFASIIPASESNVDLSNSVIYTVTAQDGSTQIYIVNSEITVNHERYLEIFNLLLIRLPFVANTSGNKTIAGVYTLEIMHEMEGCFKVSILEDGAIDESRIGQEIYYSVIQKSIIADILALYMLRRLAVMNVGGNNQTAVGSEVAPQSKYLKSTKAGSVSVEYAMIEIDNSAFIALDTPRLIEMLKSDINRKSYKVGCVFEITEDCQVILCSSKPNVPLFITSGSALPNF